MAIATLTIDLVAKLASLECDMGKAAQIAEKNARRMDQAFSAVGKTLATLGAGLSVGAFAGLVRSLADAGDEIQKLRLRTGATAEELQKLRYVAELNDASNEDLSNGLIKLNRVMGDAKNGVQQAVEAMARFGIAPDTTLSTVEAFEQIADRVKATGDETKIASALNDVFGRSFASLLPTLKSGGDEIRKTGNELERMGGVMSGELVDASAAFNDNLTRLSRKLEALKLEIVGPLIPLFLELTNALASTTDKSDELSTSGQALKTIFETIAVVGVNVAYVFNAVGKEIGGIVAQANALAHLDFKGFSAIGAAMREDAEKARKEVDALTNRLRNPFKEVTDGSNYGNEGRGRGLTQQGILDTPPVAKKASGGRAAKAKKDDPYTDLLTPAAQEYAKALESIGAATLSSEKSTLDLNAAQSTLYDLMNSPLWAQFPEQWQQVVIAQTAAATAAEKTAADYKRLNDLLAATPTEQLEKTRDTMLFLADAFYAGKISAEQFSEAASTALGNLPDDAKKATDAMNEFAVQAARNMQDAFADFLFDPFKDGVSGMLENFGIAIRKMIANAVAADLSKYLFGDIAGGEGSGLLGKGFDFLSGLVPNAAGGVYATPALAAYSGSIVSRPTVFPFAKGIGLMGEAGPEAILPLKRGSDGKLGVAAGGGGHTINVYVSGNSAPDVRRAAGQGAREALNALNGAKRYG